MAIHLLVFRHPNLSGEQAEALRKECVLLTQTTTHRKKPYREDAPQYTDCLTSIWHLLGRIQQISSVQDVQFPELVRIGNMPKKLISWNWKRYLIPTNDLVAGDLIFLKGNSKTFRLVTHLSMALSTEEIFHCSAETKGARIEKISAVFAKYKYLDDDSPVLRYTDPRPEIDPLPDKPSSFSAEESPKFEEGSFNFASQSYSPSFGSDRSLSSLSDDWTSSVASSSIGDMQMHNLTDSPSLRDFNSSTSPDEELVSDLLLLSTSPEPELVRFNCKPVLPRNAPAQEMIVHLCVPIPASPKKEAIKMDEKSLNPNTTLNHFPSSPFNPMLLNGLNRVLCSPETHCHGQLNSIQKPSSFEDKRIEAPSFDIPSAIKIEVAGSS